MASLEDRLEADVASYAKTQRDLMSSRESLSGQFQNAYNAIIAVADEKEKLEQINPLFDKIASSFKDYQNVELEASKDEAQRHAAAVAENRPIEPEAAALHHPHDATAGLENPDIDYEVPDPDFIYEPSWEEKLELVHENLFAAAEEAYKNPVAAEILQNAGFPDATHLGKQVDKIYIDQEIYMAYAKAEQRITDKVYSLENQLDTFSQDLDKGASFSAHNLVELAAHSPREAAKIFETSVCENNPLIAEIHKATEAAISLENKARWLEQTAALEKSVHLLRGLSEKVREFSDHQRDSEYRHIEQLEGPAKEKAVKGIEQAHDAVKQEIEKVYKDFLASDILQSAKPTSHTIAIGSKGYPTAEKAIEALNMGASYRLESHINDAATEAEQLLKARQNELPGRIKDARQALEEARAATYSVREKVLSTELKEVRSSAQEELKFTQNTIGRLEKEVIADQVKIEKLSQAGALYKAVSYVSGKPVSKQIEAAHARIVHNSGVIMEAEIRLGDLQTVLAEPSRANDNKFISSAENEAMIRLDMKQEQGQGKAADSHDIMALRSSVINATRPVRDAEQVIGKVVELSQARERTQTIGRARANDQALGIGR